MNLSVTPTPNNSHHIYGKALGLVSLYGVREHDGLFTLAKQGCYLVFLLVSNSNFSAFNLDGLLQNIQDLGGRIMKDQNEYARLVDKIYQRSTPLYANRPKSDDTFGEELEVIGDIIAHCLVIGDSKLLHDFIIDPINDDLANGNLTVLTFPDSLASYINAFTDFSQKSDTQTERIYWSLVINTFEDAMQKIQSGYVAIA